EMGLVVQQRLDDLLGERQLVRHAEAISKRLKRIKLVLAQHSGERGADTPQPVRRQLLSGARFEQARDDTECVVAMIDHAPPIAETIRAAIWSGGSTAAARPAAATAPGIPQTAELAASCARIVPPASQTRAPSRPMPESTTPRACEP